MKSLFSHIIRIVVTLGFVISLCLVCAEPSEEMDGTKAFLIQLAALVVFALCAKAVEAMATKDR